MKKIFILLLSLSLFMFSLSALSNKQILAEVCYFGTNELTASDFTKRLDYVQKMYNTELNTDNKKKIVNTMIEEVLIKQAANKENISISDLEVKKEFEQQICKLLNKSLYINVQLTEEELDALIKSQFNMSTEDFFIKHFSFSKDFYKDTLRTHLIIKKYITNKEKDKINSVKPSPQDIQFFFNNNRGSFVQNDIVQMLRIDVNKKNNDAEKILDDLRSKITQNSITLEDLVSNSFKEGSLYQAQRALIEISNKGLDMMGYPNMSIEDFYSIINNGVGYISDNIDTTSTISFVSIIKKYDAKLLDFNDPIIPENTITVYDNINNILTSKMVEQYLQKSLEETAKSLNNKNNVKIKYNDSIFEKL